jgi:hypothetical protein
MAAISGGSGQWLPLVRHLWESWPRRLLSRSAGAPAARGRGMSRPPVHEARSCGIVHAMKTRSCGSYGPVGCSAGQSVPRATGVWRKSAVPRGVRHANEPEQRHRQDEALGRHPPRDARLQHEQAPDPQWAFSLTLRRVGVPLRNGRPGARACNTGELAVMADQLPAVPARPSRGHG